MSSVTNTIVDLNRMYVMFVEGQKRAPTHLVLDAGTDELLVQYLNEERERKGEFGAPPLETSAGSRLWGVLVEVDRSAVAPRLERRERIALELCRLCYAMTWTMADGTCGKCKQPKESR